MHFQNEVLMVVEFIKRQQNNMLVDASFLQKGNLLHWVYAVQGALFEVVGAKF